MHCSSNASLSVLRHIFHCLGVFLCVKHLCRPFHYGVMTDEERRTKSIFTQADFQTPVKVSETLRVVLHFTVLLACLGTPAPICYVQDGILNLRHPYVGVATATPFQML